jgi:hypothetical protein
LRNGSEESKYAKACKGEVSQLVVPSQELGLRVLGSERFVFILNYVGRLHQ